MNIKKIILFMLLGVMTLPTFATFAEENNFEEVNLITNGDFENVTFTTLDWKFKIYNQWYSDGSIVEEGDSKYASVRYRSEYSC